MDHYLRFTDEAACFAALEAVGLTVVEDGMTKIHGAAGIEVDVIGSINRLAGYVGDPPEAQFTQLSGYHVNVRGELPEALQPFQIPTPNNPFRVWAA